MRNIKEFLLCVLLASSVFMFAESPKREFRATWLAAVGVDFPDKKVTTSGNTTQIDAQKKELTDWLDKLQEKNINAVLYHVRPMADAFYKSDLAPWSHYLTGTRGKDPGYDPLAFAVEEAHKRGIELHAWFNPFRHVTKSVASSIGLSTSNDPIKKNHPSWLLNYSNGSYSGTWLDPGNPEVRTYIVSVVQEVVVNYDIDGVVFDDYFYPYGDTNSEDKTSKNKYKPSSQSTADWRRENIDKAIKGVYDMIQSKKPWVRFGVSPFGYFSTQSAAYTKYGLTKPTCTSAMDAYGILYCNTLEWMNQGIVDYISPQVYWSTSSRYTKLSKFWSDAAKHFSDKLGNKEVHYYASQLAGKTSGQSRFTNSELIKQIGLNRTDNSQDAPGTIFFSTKDCFDSQGVATSMKNNRFTQLALPPAMDWKSAPTLAAPTNVSRSGSTISWSHSSASRFTVYAYTKGTSYTTAIKQSTNLKAVVYGKSVTLSGISDWTNTTVAVCAYDRYGNEYTPGLYNASGTTPPPDTPTGSITYSPSTITLSGTHNQATAPYVDVTITAANLTADMSYNASTNIVSVAPLSGWNARTGGKLRVTLDVTKAPGSYSSYVAVESGSVRKEIPVSATIAGGGTGITPAGPLTANPTSVTLTGVYKSGNNPYCDVQVVGTGLTSAITLTSATGAIIISKPGAWNDLTGGTIRLTLNTNFTTLGSGTHNSYIVVTSGDNRLEIPVIFTFTESAGGETTNPDTPSTPTAAFTASPSSITLTAKPGGTAYVDVKITPNVTLTSNISVNPNTGRATKAFLSDWDNLKGGTVRISLDATHASNQTEGTSEGYFVAVQSTSDYRIEIPLTIVLSNSAPTNPEPDTTPDPPTSSGNITASVANFALTSVFGEVPAPYISIKITANNLASAMNVVSSSSAVTVKQQSDWDGLMGGTLHCVLNTTFGIKENYVGYVALQSGADRLEIPFTITIKEGTTTPSEPDVPSVELSASVKKLWSKSTAEVGLPTDDHRSIAYHNGLLYVPNKATGAFHILNAATGAQTTTKTVTSTTPAWGLMNLRITEDGQMLLGNTEIQSTTVVVKSSSISNGGIAEVGTASINGRSDYFYPYGKWSESGYLIAVSNALTEGAVPNAVKIPFAAGKLGAAVSITNESLPIGQSAKAIPAGADAFYANAKSNIPVKYRLADGEILEQFGATQPASVTVSGMAVFSVQDNILMVTPADEYGSFEVFDITNGLSQARRVISATPSLGSAENEVFTVDFSVRVSGNKAIVYVLAPYNGIAAYELLFSTVVTSDESMVADEVRLIPTHDGVKVTFRGEQEVAIYTVDGMFIESAIRTDMYTCSLPQGAYLIRVGETMHKFVK